MWTLGKSKFSFVKVRKYREVWVLYYRHSFRNTYQSPIMWWLDSEATKDRKKFSVCVCVGGAAGKAGKLYIKLLKCVVILNRKSFKVLWSTDKTLSLGNLNGVMNELTYGTGLCQGTKL